MTVMLEENKALRLSIRRIAYWYAGDTRIQFDYRRLRIAEYHLLHWNSDIGMRRYITFVSLTVLPNARILVPVVLPWECDYVPMKRKPCFCVKYRQFLHF